MKYLLIVLVFISFACNWAKEKTKNAVNKTGEVVAKTGAEFAQGVSKGIEKTFQNEVEIADPLKKQGLPLLAHRFHTSSGSLSGIRNQL